MGAFYVNYIVQVQCHNGDRVLLLLTLIYILTELLAV